jgi:hypothetical protein
MDLYSVVSHLLEYEAVPLRNRFLVSDKVVASSSRAEILLEHFYP